MEVISLTSKDTNCYIIKSSFGFIMIDTGWPDTFNGLHNLLKQNNININDIKYLIITHFHPDHAGLTQNLKDLGINLILHESQVSYIDRLNKFFKKELKFKFKHIETENNIIVSSDNSRKFFESLGIKGELIQTPGHSDDSISIIIDEYCAFTGDLPNIALVEAYDVKELVEAGVLY